MNATPRPLRLKIHGEVLDRVYLSDQYGRAVGLISTHGIENAREHATLIVRAVNSYGAMREALENLLAMAENEGYPEWRDSTVDKAKAALAVGKE